MLTSTLDGVPGRQIVEHLGLVQGSTVRTKHLGRDIMASVKELVGGELRGYTELLNEARAEAMSRMCVAAKELGEDAAAEVFRYLTAREVQQVGAGTLTVASPAPKSFAD